MYIRYLIFAILLICNSLARAAETLDRLVATVNGHAILQSDWNDELRYECFMSGRAQRDLTPEDRRAAFERLIDQELLREQIGSTDFTPATSEQVAAQVDDLKKQYPQEHKGQSWPDALAASGMTESDVTSHVGAELNSLRQVDARFRPSIQIDNASIQDYYRQELLPKLPPGEKISLTEATPKIRELLIQKRINELLTSWLDTLRSQAQIRILGAETPTHVELPAAAGSANPDSGNKVPQ